jgi:hypothetical protein
MSVPGQFAVWGLLLTGDEVRIDTPNGLATKQHEAFHHYSRSITLSDTNALSLPASIKGWALVSDGTDAAIFRVNSDGTTIGQMAETANADQTGSTDASTNIEYGDITADDACQVKNTSGSDMDLEVVLFYKDA